MKTSDFTWCTLYICIYIYMYMYIYIHVYIYIYISIHNMYFSISVFYVVKYHLYRCWQWPMQTWPMYEQASNTWWHRNHYSRNRWNKKRTRSSPHWRKIGTAANTPGSYLSCETNVHVQSWSTLSSHHSPQTKEPRYCKKTINMFEKQQSAYFSSRSQVLKEKE